MFTWVFKCSISARYFGVFFISLLAVFMSACAEEADLDQPKEVEDAQTPPPATIDETNFSFNEVYVGQYGCQDSTESTFLNYDPRLVLEQGQCVDVETVRGSNPEQIAELESGIYAKLDTILDAYEAPDAIVFAKAGSVRFLDLAQNKIRLLRNFPGSVCDIIPARYFHQELDTATQTETWRKLDQAFVYIETSEDGISPRSCQDESIFKRYYKLALNYDAQADDYAVCSSEQDGKSSASDCKTRLAPAVSAAEAHSQLVKAWVDDLDTSDPSDKKLVYGYLGWGQDDHKLKLFDQDRDLLWSQSRTLESFGSVSIAGVTQTSPYLVNLNELEDSFYFLQMGRDHFLFEGAELFDRLGGDNVLKDRVYLLEAQDDGGGHTTLRDNQFAFDEDELVVYDGGKFFRVDYKSAYTAPISTLTYQVLPSIKDVEDVKARDAAFSQFEQGNCTYATDVAECESANDLADPAWQFVTQCTTLLGCSIPVDNTDYCILPSEETANTTHEERCTSARFEDLNEFDDPSNNLVRLGFVKYSNDYIRSLSFDFYNNELIIVVRLLEKDALLVYDISKALTDPKSQREKLLLGERLNQSIMPPILHNDGAFITTLVRDKEIFNRCYASYEEVTCDLSDIKHEGGGARCTGLDLQRGNCRTQKFTYESRALFCSDAQIDAGTCTDDNHVNPLTADRQIESATQDAKWLKALKPSSAGLETSIYALISEARAENSVAVGESAVKDEGVLLNPELYSLTLNSGPTPTVALGQRLAQMAGDVETLDAPVIVRDDSAQLSVVTQDFLSKGSKRSTQSHFLDEARSTITPVATFEYGL